MRVLGFGTYDVRAHPRVGILLDGLRARGFDVAELTEPLGLDTATRVAILRAPWRLPQLAVRLLRRWATLVRRSGRLSPVDVVVVGYLGHFDVLLARVLFRRQVLVLDHLVFARDTARDRGETGRGKGALLAVVDAAALAAADLVVVDTDEHRALVPRRQRAKAVVVPVGAPPPWFVARTRRSSDDPLRVVFFGLYTPLQGAPVVGRALGLLADDPTVEAVLIGSGQEHAATAAAARANRRIRWHDWVPPEELPAVVAAADVCLGIFGTGGKALRVVPNKVFQGAAAGCAIVTSDTPPQRRLLGDAAAYVPPGDPAALAAELRALAADRPRVRALAAAAAEHADAAFRPETIVAPLAERLAALAPAARPPRGAGRLGRLARRSLPPLPLNAWLRWDVVRRRLPPDARTVLEIGCGQGAFGARLAAAGYDYLGLEPDAASYARAAARLAAVGRGEVRSVALGELPVQPRFDVVCAFEVLEHLPDDAAALAEWTAYLRPGGTLLLSAPAFAARYGPFDEVVGHYRRYDPPALAALLAAAGLVDVEVTVYGAPLGYPLETARNVVGRRRRATAGSASMAARTSGSGRLLQPDRPVVGLLTAAVTAPFRVLQRVFPDRGTGLVARGRRAPGAAG